MKLDKPLDGKVPYRLRGTVDVYYANGKWIARSWPRRPHQPNSQPQISARAKFARMLELRAALPAEEVKIWQSAPWPEGKTWDDCWRSSMLKWFHKNDTLTPPRNPQVQKLVRFQHTYLIEGCPTMYSSIIAWTGGGNWSFPEGFPPEYQRWYFTDPKQEQTHWEINGALCYRGKKITPHYVPRPPKDNDLAMWEFEFDYNGETYTGRGTYSTEILYFGISSYQPYKPPHFDLTSYICTYPQILSYPPEVFLTFDYR